MKDKITFTKKEILKLYESLASGMKLLAELGRFSLKDDKEFNFLVEIYEDIDTIKKSIREIENHLQAPRLHYKFETWTEKVKRFEKLARIGEKK